MRDFARFSIESDDVMTWNVVGEDAAMEGKGLKRRRRRRRKIAMLVCSQRGEGKKVQVREAGEVE